MPSVKIFNMSGNEVGSMELDENIFAVEINENVMHDAVVQYLANQRQGTQSAKTRAEVRGGGRKPWRQKGTGHARQGSIRSPQWRGGGVVFAPKPRDYSFKLNSKVKNLALKSTLTEKVNENKIIVVDEIKLEEIKTKKMAEMFKNLKVEKALLVVENVLTDELIETGKDIGDGKVSITVRKGKKDEKEIIVDKKENEYNRRAVISARNIEGIKPASANSINTYDILKYDVMVVSKAAMQKIQEVYA